MGNWAFMQRGPLYQRLAPRQSQTCQRRPVETFGRACVMMSGVETRMFGDGGEEVTTTLIVLAHPDARSFNGAWAQASADASRRLGHEVLWSDLGTIGFDPAERAAHYDPEFSAQRFDPLKAQEAASARDALPADVAAETAKLHRADRVIFHFPIWWFAPPAILKGWFDRVLAHGQEHDTDRRFDLGRYVGRKALFCVTTGSKASESAHNGREGDVQMLVWPAAMTLRYLGFTVLVPEIVHGVHGYHRAASRPAFEDRLRARLDAQFDLIERFDKRARIPFNPDADFDADGRLRSDRPSHSPFIRHRP